MMIKKQLGVLAGAVVAASGANAAIVLGGDALAVFNRTGGGSFYQVVDAGVVTGDSLSGGTGFSIDISAALAGLGGVIDNFALVALKSGPVAFNYVDFVYVTDGGGLVYAGDTLNPISNLAANNRINNIQAFLDTANLGFNAEGSFGDFDGNSNVNDLLNNAGAPTQLILQAQNGGFGTSGATTDDQFIDITTPSGSAETVYIDGSSFNATASGPVIPVPAAAWLFGSALVGLGVVRRKK